MKVTVYPQNLNYNDIHINPYIRDFVHALEQNGIHISNSPHKNPLFSLLPAKTDSDAYIFHWLENVPDYKYGMLQTIAAIWLILKLKLKRKKIIWFLHNKQPHVVKHKYTKKILIKLLLHKADLIVTHATEGIEVIRKQHKTAVQHSIFLHHPTKNRISDNWQPLPPETDILIWGNITPYKGVLEFIRFASQNQLTLKIKVIGRCSSNELYNEIKKNASPYTTIENKSIPFSELAQEIQRTRFVLIPYAAETILSSGILMDSLAFGARIIGPHTGSFRDYTDNLLIQVNTFHTFEDIPSICANQEQPINIEGYRTFLNKYNWENFGKIFYKELQKIIAS